MSKSKANYFGIDIGSYAIKVASVQNKAKEILIEDIAYEVIPPEIRKTGRVDQVADQIRAMIRKVGKSKGTPVYALPTSAAIMRKIFLPANMGDEEMEGNVELELSNSLPFPIDQVYFDYLLDDEVNDEGLLGVQTIAVRRQPVDLRVDTLQSIRKNYADPQVDIDCYAYFRIIEKMAHLSPEDGVFLLDVGYKNTRVYAYNSAGIVFNRELQIGGNSVTEAMSETYSMPYEEAETQKLSGNFNPDFFDLILQPHLSAFIEQIKLAKDFFDASVKGAVNINQLFLTGGGALLPGFVEGIGNNLGNLTLLPIGMIGPFKVASKVNKRINGSLPALQTGMAQAIGLSVQ